MRKLLRFARLGVAIASVAWWCASGATSARADSLQEIFAGANEAYFAGDYAAAAAGYAQLDELGVVDGDVAFNRATAEAQLGHYGAAIQHYERALYLDAGDEEAREGLSVARELAGRRRAERQGVAEQDSAPPLTEAVFGGVSRQALGGVALLSTWVAFLALAAWLFARRESARLALAIVAPLSLLVATISGGGFYAASGWMDDGEAAVVLEESVPLREGPDPRAGERHRAPEGERAWIVDRSADWVRIRVPGVGQGWAESGSVGAVRPAAP